MGLQYGKHKCAHTCVYMSMCILSYFIHVRFFGTLWTIAPQAPLSMGFSRQKYWSGLPCPSPGDLPDPGIEPMSLLSPALAGGFFTTNATWEAHVCVCRYLRLPAVSESAKTQGLERLPGVKDKNY